MKNRSAAARKAWVTRRGGGSASTRSFMKAKRAYSRGFMEGGLGGDPREYTRAVHRTKVSSIVSREFIRNAGRSAARTAQGRATMRYLTRLDKLIG